MPRPRGLSKYKRGGNNYLYSTIPNTSIVIIISKRMIIAHVLSLVPLLCFSTSFASTNKYKFKSSSSELSSSLEDDQKGALNFGESYEDVNQVINAPAPKNPPVKELEYVHDEEPELFKEEITLKYSKNVVKSFLKKSFLWKSLPKGTVKEKGFIASMVMGIEKRFGMVKCNGVRSLMKAACRAITTNDQLLIQFILVELSEEDAASYEGLIKYFNKVLDTLPNVEPYLTTDYFLGISRELGYLFSPGLVGHIEFPDLFDKMTDDAVSPEKISEFCATNSKLEGLKALFSRHKLLADALFGRGNVPSLRDANKIIFGFVCQAAISRKSFDASWYVAFYRKYSPDHGYSLLQDILKETEFVSKYSEASPLQYSALETFAQLFTPKSKL